MNGTCTAEALGTSEPLLITEFPRVPNKWQRPICFSQSIIIITVWAQIHRGLIFLTSTSCLRHCGHNFMTMKPMARRNQIAWDCWKAWKRKEEGTARMRMWLMLADGLRATAGKDRRVFSWSFQKGKAAVAKLEGVAWLMAFDRYKVSVDLKHQLSYNSVVTRVMKKAHKRAAVPLDFTIRL